MASLLRRLAEQRAAGGAADIFFKMARQPNLSSEIAPPGRTPIPDPAAPGRSPPEASPECDTGAVARWLTDGAPSATQPLAVMAQLCERLVAAGIPLWRTALFVRTLHPAVMGRRFTWRPEAGVQTTEAGFEMLETDNYRMSPVVHVYRTGVALRRRLAAPDCPADFAILDEFRAEGITDYLVSPLRFTNGEIHVATWSTRRPGGFTDAHLAGLVAVVGPLARLTEIYALRRTASNLLDAYVGRQAGERILAGQIRRGDSEAIRAAIWLSDMRDFTALSDRLPPATLIGLLNRYFDCQVPAITGHGGEVLKFMGDGSLAIFPVDGDAAAACGAALAAARETRSRIAAMDGLPPGVDERPRFGLALHLGEVLFGNIGGGNRLDFTCIGPAVNLAARIEELTSMTGHPILASGEFAKHCSGAFAPIGAFALRGFAAPQTVFALADQEPA
jgi:adenylate cyclase